LKILRSTKKEWIQNGPTTCWTFWSLGHHAQRHSTRVPTQITCQTFKEHSYPRGAERGAVHASTVPGERGRKYSHRPHSVNFRFFHEFPHPDREPVQAQGARSIARIPGMSTFCHGLFCRRPGARPAALRPLFLKGFSQAAPSRQRHRGADRQARAPRGGSRARAWLLDLDASLGVPCAELTPPLALGYGRKLLLGRMAETDAKWVSSGPFPCAESPA